MLKSLIVTYHTPQIRVGGTITHVTLNTINNVIVSWWCNLIIKPCFEISHFLALFENFLQYLNIEFNKSTHAKKKNV